MQYESLTKRRLFRKSKTEILLTSIEAMEGAFALNRELLISFKLKEGYGRLLLLVYLLHFYKIPIRTNIIVRYTGEGLIKTGNMMAILVKKGFFISKQITGCHHYSFTDEGIKALDFYTETFTRSFNFLTKIMEDVKNENRDKSYVGRGEKVWKGRRKAQLKRIKQLKIDKS